MSKSKPTKLEGINRPGHILNEKFTFDLHGEIVQLARMRIRYNELVQENNRNGLNKYDENGRRVEEPEFQIKAQEALRQQNRLVELFGKEPHSKVTSNYKTSKENTSNVKNKRLVIVDTNRDSLAEVYKDIARNHGKEAPREVWPHFKAAIEKWAGNCIVYEKGYNHDQWRISFENNNHLKNSITYQTFRKNLARIRKSIGK